MANEAFITLTGNATADSELRQTPSGVAVTNVSIAVTPREKVGDVWQDGQAAFYRVAAWRDMAQHVAESVRKGDRVTVVGRLKPREYEHNGEKRTSLDVEADSIALDLRFRTAHAAPKQQGGSWSGQQPQQQAPQQTYQPSHGGPRQQADDPWQSPRQQAMPVGGQQPVYDEPPF